MTWRAAHKDRQKATTAAWQAANKDKMKAYQAARYAENPEKIKASAANWAKVNRKSRRITEQNREARKRENGGVLSKGLATKLFKLQKAKCPCCNQLLGKDYHLDHNMPIALGVMNIDSNMQLLRKRCNLQKSAKNPVEFMQSKGFLL